MDREQSLAGGARGARSERGAPPRPRRLAFAGGTVGVGTSSLVRGVACLLQRRGQRVVVHDGGADCPEALSGPGPDRRGPAALTIDGRAVTTERPAEGRSKLEGRGGPTGATRPREDFVLVDAGAGAGDGVRRRLFQSNEAIVVTRPDPPAVAAAYALIQVVVDHDLSYPLHVLVNMVRDATEADTVFRTLSQALVRTAGYQPGYAGFVFTDPAVGQADGRRVSFTQAASRAPASRCVERLVRMLVEPTVPAEPAPRSLWERCAADWWRGRS